MKRICIHCGSSPGALPEYATAAHRCGTILAERGPALVCGVGNIGIMGVVTDAALAAGGEAIDVILHKMIARGLA